jgi:hypothetical protein
MRSGRESWKAFSNWMGARKTSLECVGPEASPPSGAAQPRALRDAATRRPGFREGL